VEPIIEKDKRKSQRVPVEITLLAMVDERQVAMKTENISLEGLFLQSREFVRPATCFFSYIWLPERDEPLQVFLTSSFTEQTWNGYGIGVHLSGISAPDRAEWEAYYRECAAAHAQQLHDQAEAERAVLDRRLVVIGSALHTLAVQALLKKGLAV